MLAQQELISPTGTLQTQAELVVQQFGSFLSEQRALVRRTINNRKTIVTAFLAQRFGKRYFQFSNIKAEDLIAFVHKEAIRRRNTIKTVETGAHLRVIGKGRKERCTPLAKRTIKILRAWFKEPWCSKYDRVFTNARGEKLSADGIQYIIAKHARAARMTCPSLTKKRVTPHVLRHTAAMELLQAGVDRTVIALWLGMNQWRPPKSTWTQTLP